VGEWQKKYIHIWVNVKTTKKKSFRSYIKVLNLLGVYSLYLYRVKKHASSFSFLLADIQFSQQHLLKRLSFLHHMFISTLVKNQAWILIWVFYSVPSVSMPVFLSAPCWFYSYGYSTV
jgi:hypothetical protein